MASPSTASSPRSESRLPTSIPSSPPDSNDDLEGADDALVKEEQEARAENDKNEEKRRQALMKKKKKKKAETKSEREAKARELDDLLAKSAAFSDILTKKTQVLGRVGSSLDGTTLGEHNLKMAQQPKCMINGTMRDYQLEGLTWMYEICSQGMSGILADEMGLGKTVQTIALIALLREQENYLGPHLIVAPLMVCTSYEMVLRDQHNLSRINWEFIIIDEGHRMKNAEAKLFQQLRQFSSATRLLITGTPLQNNLKELWSLLHFLLPNIFTDWEAFESWFDFSDLQDEEGTEEFIADQKKQALVKKIHLILQPMLLRRVKADVAAYLPKKREYVLFAPMTKDQTDLYNVLTDKKVDTREYLENKVLEKLNAGVSATPSAKSSRSSSRAPPKTMSLPVRESSRKKEVKSEEPEKSKEPAPNAFSVMMKKRGRGRPPKNPKPDASIQTPQKPGTKRKNHPVALEPEPKSTKSSRQATPVGLRRRSRKTRTYKDAGSDEEKMSDDEFEAKLANEMESDDEDKDDKASMTPEERERAEAFELAKKQISHKKLGNPMAQLRLVCNSPHNFYNPWKASTELPVDDSIVTASGKMLLLDRLLPRLFEGGHKVLIFSQFTTQLDILEDYCAELRGWKVCRIDGSVAQDSRRTQIADFNSDPEYKIFLLSTRAGGQGINLASADTVILFDSDFNPQQDLQAQDRCHRIGQTRPVVVFRLATKDTVEESLLNSADAKRRLEKLVIKKGNFKTMGQKMDLREDLDPESLRALLLKDGQVYKVSGGEEVLSDSDLDVLCDRSDSAYEKC
ncbi:hypothetical protein NXS19_008564 [Fusarium pseudograminearum]|nr:hypothetical protein NXS19_008564 [Fusarium pseudograminearum]